MSTSVLGHFGPKDRTDLATSVLRKAITVLYDHMMDRSVPSAEVVKALRSLVNSVLGHFGPLKRPK